MYALLALAAPLGVATAGLLRPRFGHFPVLLLLLCLLCVLLLRKGVPGFGRRATLMALLAAFLLVLSWAPRIAARSWGRPLLTPAYHRYVILPSTVIQVAVFLCLASAPLWLPLGLYARRWRRLAPPLPDAGGPTRRDVLSTIARATPAAMVLLSGYGVAVGAQRIAVRRLRLAVPGLPPALRGLRLGQITDAHVARDLTPLAHVEQGLGLLAGERLDLLLCTGDLCDDPTLLPALLRAIGQVPARLGRYACLGNHELYLGLPYVRRCYDRSDVRLLIDESVRLPGSGDLSLAGLSYPHARTPRFDPHKVPGLLGKTLADRGPGGATVLLAHHPHVFPHLRGLKVDLMLAGHTHGGQIGVPGPSDRSLFEGAYGFVRGHFQAPDTGQLFVSSGIGHWLPFRVNCPPEVVIIELS